MTSNFSVYLNKPKAGSYPIKIHKFECKRRQNHDYKTKNTKWYDFHDKSSAEQKARDVAKDLQTKWKYAQCGGEFCFPCKSNSAIGV